MTRAMQWDPQEQLVLFSRTLLRKMAVIGVAWIAIYFLTQWVGNGAWALFSLPIGTVLGFVIGWSVAENAVAEAGGVSGFWLWVMLTVACWVPIAFVERSLSFLTGWEMSFGRWMLLVAAWLMSMSAAVWRASADA